MSKDASQTVVVMCLAILTASPLFTSSSCAWLKKEEPVAQAALDCAETKLAGQAVNIVPTILEIVLTGGADWQSVLVDRLGKVGADVLTCAYALVEQGLLDAAPDAGTPPKLTRPEASRQLALVRVRHLRAGRKPVK